MDEEDPVTNRVFFLGAGFSKPAGLPLAVELLDLVQEVARETLSVDGYNHLDHAIDRYKDYLRDIDPDRAFDLEEFGAWLDWEFVLRLRGSDTFSEHGNQAALQLRWGIGKVLHELIPAEIPALYLDFARRLTTSDHVMTLNYDLLLEGALEAVNLPYRRYPGPYSEVHEYGAVWDSDAPKALVISKLHGSIDWTYPSIRERDDARLGLTYLVEGPRPHDDPLLRIRQIPGRALSHYFNSRASWHENPMLLMQPSTAKPMGGSPLVPLWDGLGSYAPLYGGLTIIGCSLPPGDPYVIQLLHGMTTAYAYGRREASAPWPQRRMKIVDLREGDSAAELRRRYRFVDERHADFVLDGLSQSNLERIFNDE